jgi:hypothetical protein
MDETVDEYKCPVCLTNGSDSGKVIPTSCNHPLCINCYSNIILHNQILCPVCRTPYNVFVVENSQENPEQINEQSRIVRAYVNYVLVIFGYKIRLCSIRVR